MKGSQRIKKKIPILLNDPFLYGSLWGMGNCVEETNRLTHTVRTRQIFVSKYGLDIELTKDNN